MKHLILTLVLFASVSAAEEVTVTGYGTTYGSAIDNAKIMALEAGAGTFIIGESTARNNIITENIDQYNGGVITKYKIVSSNKKLSGYEVTIVADVVPKNNNVIKTQPSTMHINYDEYEQREKIVNRLNNVGKAIHAQVLKPSYKIGQTETTIYSKVVLTWQPKWVSDMRSFTSVIADKGKTTNNIYDNVSGSIISTMITRIGLGGAIFGAALDSTAKQHSPQNSDTMMVCFSDTSNLSFDCHNLNVDISFPRNPKLVLIGNIGDRSVILHEQYLDAALYRYVNAGENVSNTAFIRSNYKTKFYNPSFVIYEQESQTVDLTFNVENSIIKSVKSINVYLK